MERAYFLQDIFIVKNVVLKIIGGVKKTFYHQLLSSAIVNPDTNVVLPLLHEAITHQDGKTKNDCEQNAAKRLIPDLKKAFPALRYDYC